MCRQATGQLKFSLVTTCRNEIESFETWKSNILAQTRRPDEIIVVDAFSDDGTFEALTEWHAEDGRVHVIQEKGAAAHGRNVAIAAASNELIVSTDMGVRLASIWCEELVKPFEEDSKVEVVLGNSIIDRESVKSAVARAEWFLENGGEVLNSSYPVPNNRSVAYYKRVWDELGGLPEDLTFYADDSVFGRQIVNAGYILRFAPKAMTYWSRPNALSAFWREQYVYGVGDGEAAIKMPYAVKLFLDGKVSISFAKVLNGLRQTQKSVSLSAIGAALRRADLLSALLMPVLSFGNGWSRVSGYVEGFERGGIHCKAARARLSGESNIGLNCQ